MRKTSDLTVEDASMHHANMMRDIIAGIEEDLQQEQSQTDTPTVVPALVDHVANTAQNTQK